MLIAIENNQEAIIESPGSLPSPLVEDEGSDSESWVDDSDDLETHDLPPAISLFFSHIDITNTIDQLESVVLDKQGHWSIERAIHTLINLVMNRNVSKMSESPSRSEIKDYVLHLYSTRFKPFLKALGIRLSGENEFVWKWEDNVLDYCDMMYITMFRNLTENGNVSHSRTFIQLFPKLFLLADSGAASSVSRIENRIRGVLTKKGKINNDIDHIVQMIDQLVEERCSLKKLEGQNCGSFVASPLGKLMEQQAKLRANRLDEIEKMLSALQELFNKLTLTAAETVADFQMDQTKIEEEKEPVIALQDLIAGFKSIK